MIRSTFACALLLAALIGGCASPDPVLYTVAPVRGPVLSGAPRVVVLRRIALAGYLDRQHIVRSSENFRLDVQANDWWGEPLGAMLNRVLVQELGQRLPATSVYAESGAVTVAPDATVELNLQRMDADAAGNVVLMAQGAITFSDHRPPLTRSFAFTAPAGGPGTPGEVAAISATLGQLADGLAAMLAGTGRS